MHITRRDFIKYAGASAAALGLSRWQIDERRPHPGCRRQAAGHLAERLGLHRLLGLAAQRRQPDHRPGAAEHHQPAVPPNVMAAAGDLAVSAARSTAAAGGYILVVEGAIPTGQRRASTATSGTRAATVTMASAVTSLAANGRPRRRRRHLRRVRRHSAQQPRGRGPGRRRLSGSCGGEPARLPSHPDWIIGSAGPAPRRHAAGARRLRPAQGLLHAAADPRALPAPRDGRKRDSFGQDGLCLKELGCKGPTTHADCDSRDWNNGQNWCIGANGLCIGCTEPNFPAFPLHKDVTDSSPHHARPVPGTLPGRYTATASVTRSH